MANNWFSKQLGTQQPARQQQVPTVDQQHVSPDGKWKWDGEQWIPNKPSAPMRPPPPPEDLPEFAMQAKIDQGSATCPRCGIDDTFFPQAGKNGRRCFSCGHNEIETAAHTAASYDPSRRGTSSSPATPARGQSGGSWQGADRTEHPPQTRDYR